MPNHQDFLNTTLTAAAKIAVANFGNLSHSVKAGDRNQVLTETDLEIGHFLTDAIRTAYPDHNIIDEELGCVDNGSRYTWVVDPIDGTSNFAVGLPQYGIMLGLLDHDTPVAGGIALPTFGELYIATKGAGAWCNGQKIHVSRESDLANSLVAYGIDGHPEDPARTKCEAELYLAPSSSRSVIFAPPTVFSTKQWLRGVPMALAPTKRARSGTTSRSRSLLRKQAASIPILLVTPWITTTP